ncbi:MAG: aldo/keto reductase [Bacteroidota bacterium]
MDIEVQGKKIPAIGFGTWALRGKDCTESVADALKIGYRHIDTAHTYGNEEEVGEGIRQSGVKRKDIFLVTKIPPNRLEPDDIVDTANESLAKLGFSYVDMLLIHWPSPGMKLEAALKVLLDLQSEGKTRMIGVSNFSKVLAEQALSIGPIVCNQVELNPYNYDQTKENINFANDNDMMITAYTPLAKGKVSRDPILQKIGERYQKKPAQVALRWLLQLGNVAVIPKASTREHRIDNLNILDFELKYEEIQEIKSITGVHSVF